MLKEVIEKNLFAFYNEATDWKDAIRKCLVPLIENGVCKKEYEDELINCVEKYGPYIVIEPGIAMPHSTQNGNNVMRTEIGFTKFEKSVKFDEENEASLFFTLASVNPEVHIENIQKLMEVLTNDELKEELFKINSVEQLKKLSEKYNL